ncbi:MAG: hypothetical protein ACI93S_001274 [Ancylomarina sp.]|jgi:hypothetical protein
MAKWEIRMGCQAHQNCICSISIIFCNWNRTLPHTLGGKNVIKIASLSQNQYLYKQKAANHELVAFLYTSTLIAIRSYLLL